MTVTDTQGNTGTKVQPSKDGKAGKGRGPNRVPVRRDPVEVVPERNRKGFWAKEFENTLKPNPGKTYPYENVSATAQTTLKQKYGVNATTRTENGETVLYACYEPAKAEQVKADAKASAAKRSAAAKAKK